MKSLIKEFIPPIFLKLLQKKALEMPIENSHQIFINYQDALKMCTTDAYEERELIEVIFKKTKRFSENQIRNNTYWGNGCLQFTFGNQPYY